MIVGGGIGGFSVGIGLLQNGYEDVMIYERDTGMEVRRQGYGLTILQGINALKKFNVFEEVQSLDTPSRSHFIFNKDGSLIGFFGTIFWPEENHQPKSRKKYNLHCQRQDLRRILMNKYISLHPKGEEGIQWNHKVKHIDRLTRQISFSNDYQVTDVELLIGADGINGLVRSFKIDPELDRPLNYLGMIVILGITGGIDHYLMKDRVFQSMDGSSRLFAMPFSKFKEEESIMWQLSFPTSLDFANQLSKDLQFLKDYLMDKLKDWHSPIPQMIEKTRLELLMGIPAFDRDLFSSCEEETKDILPIALIGDACHPMSPFKGQGANQALLDALDLSQLMKQNNGNDLHSLINEYEKQMLKRVESKVMESRERVKTFHRPEALSSNNFFYRGINEQLIDQLNSVGMNAHWNNPDVSIEQRISNLIQQSSNQMTNDSLSTFSNKTE